MKRRTYLISFAATCLLVYLGYTYLYSVDRLKRAAKQDTCEFPTVTNNEFQELLNRARQLSKGRETQFQGDQTALGNEIKRRIDEFATEKEGIFFRLAAMHATLRAVDAHFAGGSATQFKEWDGNFSKTRSIDSQGSVAYFYRVPLSAFGVSSVFYRDASVIISLSIFRENDRISSVGIQRNGDFRTVVNIPNIVNTVLKGDRPPQNNETEVYCPPVPSVEWAASFDEWRATLPGDAK